MMHRHITLAACAATLVVASGLSACSSMDGALSGARVDYRREAAKTPELEVPPDLSQLARDSRYRPQSGVVTASGVAAGAAGAAPATPAQSVALSSIGDMRVERDGNFRWLVVPMAPEQLWPVLEAFWRDNGFALTVSNAATGVMETGWAENRARIPQDLVRRTIGRVFEGLYDSGTRDSFRTRVERGARGTEVYILHRSVVEQLVGPRDERTVWRSGPNDPQLEAEFLSRLMVRLGARETAAREVVAAAPQPPAPVPAAAAAKPLASGATALDVDEPFDRAYRRVGIALDRAGFTVEDRDRSAGLYFVRYVPSGDPEEQGFFGRLFGGRDAQTPVRYRVLVKASGDNRSTVSVQNSQGQPETGEVAQRIIGLVGRQLR